MPSSAAKYGKALNYTFSRRCPISALHENRYRNGGIEMEHLSVKG